MLFQRSKITNLLSYLLIIIIFSIASYFLGQSYPLKYVLFISSTILLTFIVYSIYCKSYYEIVEDKIRFFRGKKFEEININKILYIRINTLEGSGSHNIKSVIHDVAYLVLGDRKIKISTMLRNKNEENIIMVLNKRHNKKIKYDS